MGNLLIAEQGGADVKGEAPLAYGSDGLPTYVTLKNVAVAKKLPAWEG
ncbi:hypothetical protein [Xanthomonas oryzae]|nr:hypothetical protein [Xanthomonas oryzae]UNE63562.1 hypothetical protein MML47_04730 [Xanthomonas oryzae]